LCVYLQFNINKIHSVLFCSDLGWLPEREHLAQVSYQHDAVLSPNQQCRSTEGKGWYTLSVLMTVSRDNTVQGQHSLPTPVSGMTSVFMVQSYSPCGDNVHPIQYIVSGNHPTQNIYQAASRSVQPFLQSSQQTGQSVPIPYNGLPLSPQNCPSHGGSRPPSTHGSLRPRKSAPKSISIDSAAGRTITIQRQTNGQTTLLHP